MPSTSPKQRKFMAAAAEDPAFAAKVNIPQKVAQEFHEADKRLKNHEDRGYFKMAKTKGGL